MVSGGGEYNQEAKRAVRFISVLITPFIALYTLLVTTGVIASTHYIGDPIIALSIALLWVVLSFYFYVREVKSRTEETIRLIIYHVLALLIFSLVLGFWQPFAPLYVLLILASNLYFGRRGLVYSLGAVAVVGLADILLRFPYAPGVIYDTGLPVISLLFLGIALIGILHTQETKRQALVHSRERERLQYDRVLTIMNNLSDASFSTDENGKVLLYNAASLDLLDTNASIKGRLIWELFNLSTAENGPTNLFDILKDTTRTTRRDDLIHTYPDGETVRLEVTFAPIRSSYSLNKKKEEQGGYIVIVRDITNKKSLEEERDEFISVVSHELRTPITIVEGTLSNLDLLMKQPKLPSTKMLANTVTTAHEQVLYLARMVNDLSTLSRAERGVADAPEEIDVTELLNGLHKKYEKEAEARKLHLNLDLGAKLGKVNVSRLYLEELLQNFITNAIKYTNSGSVTIIAKKVKNTITFSVKDTGIGISRSEVTKVFNKFYRSEDYRIRETNGTGLGLYVSAKLAKKLNTSIEVSSRLNHGSTFSFELPAE